MKKTEVFNQYYSKYYNLFYQDKDYATEVEYVNSVIKKYAQGEAESILEYGMGTGGHALKLKDLGYEILGIERSKEMAEVANQRELNCIVGDITNFTIDRHFDVCMALFHVISYINDNASLRAVFENTKRHLRPGGLFIFDVWFTPAVMHQLPETRIKKLDNEEIEITRIAQPLLDYRRNIVDVNYHIFLKDKKTGHYQEFSESHSMRHFSIPEIELVAESSGFVLIQAEAFLTGAVPDNNTWGVNFILQLK